MPTVKRRINFFRVALGRSVQNTIVPVNDVDEIEIAINDSRNIINNLPFDLGSRHSRYLRLYNGNDLSLYIDSITGGKVEGRIVLCRRNLLPEIEEGGNLVSLQIAENAGLAEITHFIYYYRYNIMGLEFNFYGPKSGSLVEYFQDKLSGTIDQFSLTPIIDQTWNNLLEDGRYRLGMFGFKASRNAADIIRRLNSNLGNAFAAAANASDAECVEIVLRRRPRSRDSFDTDGFHWDNLFENNFEHREEFDKLKIEIFEDGGSAREVDLLINKLCVSKNVELVEGRSRSLISTSVYDAISQSFEECSDQLLLAQRI